MLFSLVGSGKERLDIGLLVGGSSKEVYDQSKMIAKNLINKYDANSLASTVRFSLVSYGSQSSIRKRFDKNNNKINILSLVSRLEFPNTVADLSKGLDVMKSTIFSECNRDSKCTSPRKVLVIFTDRKLSENNEVSLRELTESGVNVVLVVITDNLNEENFDLNGINVIVLPLGSVEIDTGIIIIDHFEKGK